MIIDDLATRLSREDPRSALPSSLVMLGSIGLAALITVLALVLFWLQPRTDLGSQLAANYVFVLKLIFTLGVVAIAMPALLDLSTPGRRLR